jgi:hypothetical protein
MRKREADASDSVDLNVMVIDIEPLADGPAPPAAARKMREPLAEALDLDQDPIAMTGDEFLDSLMKG